MIRLDDNLEYMILNTCNLNCPNCDRFSNFELTPYFITVEDFKKDIIEWGKVSFIDELCLLGGETFMHPNLVDLLQVAKEYANTGIIRIITNGTLFHKKRNFNVIDTLLSFNIPAVLEVSIHLNDDLEKKKIWNNLKKYILKDFKWVPKSKTRITYKNVTIYIRDYTAPDMLWHPYNRIVDNKLKPYQDDNPELSWKRCGFYKCASIYKGKLYKCPRTALLSDYLNKFNLIDDPDWKKYLHYKGVSYDDGLEALEKFVKQRKHSEAVCGMCPAYELAKPQRDAKFK